MTKRNLFNTAVKSQICFTRKREETRAPGHWQPEETSSTKLIKINCNYMYIHNVLEQKSTAMFLKCYFMCMLITLKYFLYR